MDSHCTTASYIPFGSQPPSAPHGRPHLYHTSSQQMLDPLSDQYGHHITHNHHQPLPHHRQRSAGPQISQSSRRKSTTSSRNRKPSHPLPSSSSRGRSTHHQPPSRNQMQLQQQDLALSCSQRPPARFHSKNRSSPLLQVPHFGHTVHTQQLSRCKSNSSLPSSHRLSSTDMASISNGFSPAPTLFSKQAPFLEVQ